MCNFSIHHDKALYQDGYNARFYHEFWPLIKSDLMSFVHQFFLHNQLDPGVNATTIVLIPKRLDACRIADFKPIGLCNVQYKIIS